MTWAVLMRRNSERSAEPVELTVPGQGTVRMLVTDLTTGTWNVHRQGSSGGIKLHVSKDSGAAWFDGPAGTWTLVSLTRP